MRSFPPIREEYREFDTFAQQFKTREAAERYIRSRNIGKRAGIVDDTQSKLLDYSFGPERYIHSHHVSSRGLEYDQLHKQTTTERIIKGKVYRRGSFIPFSADEDADFKDLTLKMLIADDKGTVKK